MFKKGLLSLFAVSALTLLPIHAAAFPDMPSDYATTALEAAVSNGLLGGTQDGLLVPNNKLTRAEMATILVRAFDAQEGDYSAQFTDVQSSHWFYDEIAMAVEMGIFQGNGSSMNPNAAITRQDAFLVLSRAFGFDDGDPAVLAQFTDGNAVSDYARAGVAALVEKGLVLGSAGALNPTDGISRKDFAVMMDRLVKTYLPQGETLTAVTLESVMIQGGAAKLDNVTITGDLYIGDGASTGTVTLTDVTVEGRVYVRGGQSIIINGASDVPAIELRNDDPSVLQIADGVLINGTPHTTETPSTGGDSMGGGSMGGGSTGGGSTGGGSTGGGSTGGGSTGGGSTGGGSTGGDDTTTSTISQLRTDAIAALQATLTEIYANYTYTSANKDTLDALLEKGAASINQADSATTITAARTAAAAALTDKAAQLKAAMEDNMPDSSGAIGSFS